MAIVFRSPATRNTMVKLIQIRLVPARLKSVLMGATPTTLQYVLMLHPRVFVWLQSFGLVMLSTTVATNC